MLMDIANVAAGTSIDLHISVFVTCLCNPEAVPTIPNSTVTMERPSVQKLLDDLLTPPCSHASPKASGDIEGDAVEQKASGDIERLSGIPALNWVGLGGGVGVCVSGPETLTREAQNAVARVGMTRGLELGGIALHTEIFSL
jgi:hypothetical protein